MPEELAAQRRAAQRLQLQYVVLRLLDEANTLGEAAHRLLRVVCERLGWERSELWNVDRQAQTLECLETWHAASPAQAAVDDATCRLTCRAGTGLAGRVWVDRAPVEFADPASAEVPARAAAMRAAGLAGAFAFPLRRGIDTVGVMVFYSRDLGRSDPELGALFTSLADEITRFAEHRRATQALRDSEERFRSLSACSPLGIFQSDPQGDCTYANPCCRTLWGLAADAPLPGAWIRLVHPADRGRVEPAWFAAVAQASGFADEFRLCPPHAPVRWVSLRSAPLFSDTAELRGFVGTVEDITDRNRSQKAMRDLSTRVLQTQEDERKRVARELHDGVIQILSSAKSRLLSGARLDAGGHGGKRGEDDQVLALVDRSIEEVRRISRNLRPSELDDLGLPAALRTLCDDFRERSGLKLKLKLSPLSGKLPTETDLILYRILQEGLTNIERHAQATRVVVALREADGAIQLRLRDNGKGFLAPGPDRRAAGGAGLGLVDMRERALLVGGQLTIESAPGQGAELIARIPLPRAAGCGGE